MMPLPAVWAAFLAVWAASLFWLGGVSHHGTPATAVALAALYLVSLLVLKEPARLSRSALVCLGAVGATFLVQILPGPAFLFPYTAALRDRHGLGPWWPATADAYYTARVLAQVTTYTLSGLLVLRLRQAGLSTSSVLAGLTGILVLEALVGLVQQFGGIKDIPFYGPRPSPDSASGTFVSRNNFGGLMAVAFVVAVARAWSRFAWPHRGSDKPRWIRRVEGGWTWALAAFLFAVALVASKSRGANLAALGGLALLPLLHRGRAGMAGIAALVGVAAVAVFVANPSGLAERFATIDPFDLGADQRWTIFTTTAAAALHQPVLGFGWGTHPRAYHPFQPPSLFGQIHHAHSEYVNIFFEAGAVGLAVCLAAMGVWFVRVWRAQRPLPGPDRLPVTAALAAAAVVLLHSFVDFDLRMPAIGIAWGALLGLGAAAVRDGEPRPTWPVALVALLAAAAAWLLPARGSLGFSPYDHEAAWDKGDVAVAADLWPADPDVQREAGLIAWRRGDKARAAVCFQRLFTTAPEMVDLVLEEVGRDGFEALLPPTPAARAMYAGALAQRGLWKEAGEAFERGPVDAAGCDYFASRLEAGGQWGLEAAVREKRLGLRSDAWAHAAAARAWLKLGWLDRALERATTAARIDPSTATWPALRGDILAEKGERLAAVEAYTAALALAPAELEWRVRRGFVELADKTCAAAADDFQAVLKSRPKDRRVTLGLARALIGQDLLPSARVLLDEWLRRSPDDAEAAALRETTK
ncbi:MAG: tetratricopeptide repeat protein [Planctomycetaceae bacterium]|nr:tetratricopeptide repeat protein [Planctomycetaceae bacterium]